ncbi:uncharacterized serine-rich protein C215.13-like [Stegodyphus dumicola]|uniref:uncharacterized serine-rich protein C215.13-like n=1 Tax=Stegodyphus dumicola TaxID=202533 RepID=UPI0015AABBF2|nr:uncharacterized serine-rich protein C215.13-like [Stegodyphus dumicola]XP_035210234.1 uncharacterized serine-rich protein C215.13-like [Stegodyphus dumicola]
MNRYLLLILLSSWSLLVTNSLQCETGVANVGHVLSVQRSLMANADVAFLKSYQAPSVERCMEDCCSGKYGACTVASFKKNTTKDNCLHFNCLPLTKCKFLSSTSIDSFSFSSSPIKLHPVPSNHSSSKNSTTTTTTTTTSEPEHQAQYGSKQSSTTVEGIPTFTVEQFAMKNDNTTIKPRKGVEDLMPDALIKSNFTRSGVKPRKGVTMEDVPHSKYLSSNVSRSKVKPRKGVGPYASPTVISLQTETASPEIQTSTASANKYHSVSPSLLPQNDELPNDMLSDLKKIFEDDPSVQSSSVHSVSEEIKVSPTVSSNVPGSSSHKYASSSATEYRVLPYTLKSSIGSHAGTTQPSSLHSSILEASSIKLLSDSAAIYTVMPPLPISSFTSQSKSDSSVAASSVLTAKAPILTSDEKLQSDEESENDRKYKSSMHLVLSLVFGLLVLFAVLGVVAKRVYDGWLRRDYYRMNYLIDGVYNGYG